MGKAATSDDVVGKLTLELVGARDVQGVVERLRAEPGDVLVLELSRPVPRHALEAMCRSLKDLCPEGVLCGVIESGRLKLIRAAEAEHLRT